MEYELKLVEEKVKQHQVTALHLTCSLAFIGAGAIIYVYNQSIKIWGLSLLTAGFLLLGNTIFKNKMVTAPQNNRIFRIIELLIAGALAIYSLIEQWNLPLGIFGVLSAALAFALFWERKGNSIQYIHISDAGISLPFESRKRSIDWTEVDNVLLRFGTLSINCSDNRLFQWNVQESSFPTTELETYCSQQVENNRTKRRKNDW